MPAPVRFNLLIDADDTLWENNIYFERAFDDFCDFLAHSSLTPAEVRAVLDEIEIANNKVHGYGSLNFGRNLSQCYRHLADRHIHPEDLDTVIAFAQRILDQPLEIIDGVPETLAHLAARHDLTLFTKGHPDEQKLKIDRSGLAEHFTHTAIVKEKDRAAYESLAATRALDKDRTWMIGNSPKSDINPALAAGFHAVFIPHARTWTLEHEDLATGYGDRLLYLPDFRSLQDRF